MFILIVFVVTSLVTVLLGRRYRTCRNTQAEEAKSIVYGYPGLSVLLMVVLALDADGFGTWVAMTLFVLLTIAALVAGHGAMNGLLRT